MKKLDRSDYIEWLMKWKDKQIIKVVTGVRRCGKSTILEMYQDCLVQDGVSKEQIIAINFENLEYEYLLEYNSLYQYVKKHLNSEQMNYIFLDEIQHVKQYEKAVDSFFLHENCDVYITGSNAWFMSGELATLLTGRYVELKMMPLSFKEYCQGISDMNIQLSPDELLNRYIETGSFPYVLRYGYDKQEAREYMNGIFNTILLNDIVKRLKIADVNMLEAVTKFMMHNIGNRTSPNTIANTLTSSQKKIDQKTVDRYIRGITDSLLFYEARRYNIKGKQFLTTMNKYYVCDIGMRNILVRGQETDIGHILENLVYLELRRRYPEVYVGQLGANGEIDFVTVKNGIPSYFQVSQTTLDENVLTRELIPLRKIKDNHPKYLLTLDTVFGEMNYDGIQKLNILKWMME